MSSFDKAQKNTPKKFYFLFIFLLKTITDTLSKRSYCFSKKIASWSEKLKFLNTPRLDSLKHISAATILEYQFVMKFNRCNFFQDTSFLFIFQSVDSSLMVSISRYSSHRLGYCLQLNAMLLSLSVATSQTATSFSTLKSTSL